MLSLLYFDVEDFTSPPDHPSHRLPGEFAKIMTKHNFGGGCFHIMGQKVRYMVRHGQDDIIKAIRAHDVSLHYDRGSIQPLTAVETSRLDWHEAISRVLFRERPGVDLLMDVFGKCSGLTRHMWTWSPPIAYAAGRMGLPFFNGPLWPPGHGVIWMCNNLDILGLEREEETFLDPVYYDTPKFEQRLELAMKTLKELSQQRDHTSMFGCHPSYTLYERYIDHSFHGGQNPKLTDLLPPAERPADVAIVLRNFERFLEALQAAPDVTWTNVAGIKRLYRNRPVHIAKRHVEEFARGVVERRGPAYTDVLTAAEGIVLLARDRLAPAERYEVPTVMGPLSPQPINGSAIPSADALTELAGGLIDYVYGTGFLPAICRLGDADISVDPATLVVRLALAFLGNEAEAVGPLDNVKPTVLDSMNLGPIEGFDRGGVANSECDDRKLAERLSLQSWTLKPAFQRGDYADDVETAPYERPMILTEWSEYDGHVVSY